MLQHKEEVFSKLMVKNNLEDKEQIIVSDGKLATIMQQQEDYEAHKLTEKDQQAITSTLTGKALLLIWSVVSLHHFLQSYTPQNLGVS